MLLKSNPLGLSVHLSAAVRFACAELNWHQSEGGRRVRVGGRAAVAAAAAARKWRGSGEEVAKEKKK